jgi:uncharacterized iron-regulated protein
LSVLFVSACAQVQQKDAALPLVLNDHPLVGKVYAVKQGRLIEQEALAKALQQGQYVLLGETHDNVAHHRGQQWALEQLAKTDQTAGSTIAFEMIDEAQGEYIKEVAFDSVDELIGLLNHVNTQWGYETYYRPVFKAALQAKLNIVPASPSRESILKIVRGGGEDIPADMRALMEKTDLGEAQTEASRKEIEMSHCGMSNEKMVEAMMLTQRAKDAYMALALEDDKSGSVTPAYKILVAGSGHARNDRGVPLYIQQLHNDANMVSLGWVEVVDGINQVEEYSQHWGVEAFPFDYVWFTARADRPDPCEAFRKHMKKRHTQTEE